MLGVIYLPLSAKVEALEGLSDKLGVKPGSEVRFEVRFEVWVGVRSGV